MFNPSISNQLSYRVIGVMSGTSLDGLDICLCDFSYDFGKWNYKIVDATTIDYNADVKEKLSSAISISGVDLTKLDYNFGKWIGQRVKEFISQNDYKLDFVASHGHTIFHKPSDGFTLQIGKGSAIAAETGLPCICDFRSSDVGRAGQGAPLVPIGDRLLFSDYDICLNLGGFANLSFEDNHQRLAFDIGPCNIILNHLVKVFGVNYDSNGEFGQKGEINELLLNELNLLDFYKIKSPKSLGREWVEEVFLPKLEQPNIPIYDKLRTAYEHISIQICNAANQIEGKSILATGGGAHNKLLIHLLETKSNKPIIIPDKQTVDYKEALIFAFLGVTYFRRIPGALSSVTGANSDSISGCLYY
jgi:anhydro-N-acetylmuramic acid kinase